MDKEPIQFVHRGLKNGYYNRHACSVINVLQTAHHKRKPMGAAHGFVDGNSQLTKKPSGSWPSYFYSPQFVLLPKRYNSVLLTWLNFNPSKDMQWHPL